MAEFSPPIGDLTARSTNSHYRSVLSLPDLRIVTTDRCSHYQITEFSLPIDVVTTRSSNCHYRSMFSLPFCTLSRIFTFIPPFTRPSPVCGSSNSHFRSMFSLSDLRILTTDRCSHYQIFEFSLPIGRVTNSAMNSHYRSVMSLPEQ